MEYFKINLKQEIIINRIITVHYFEFARDYIFEGEKHNFWEFIYVDKGEVEVMSGSRGYRLKQGELLFHKPGVFHNEYADGKIAPNVIVVSFECVSNAMGFFENKILSAGNFERDLLAGIIKEAKNAFSSPLNDAGLKRLEKRPSSLFGCEQLIKLYIEQLLISLIRKGSSISSGKRLSSSVKERSDEDTVNRIFKYMKENIRNNIRFDDVVRFCSMSSTNLKVLFKDKTGTGVMEYYRNLKIDEAKTMIREGNYNITEIARILGYETIHYFSRQFKTQTGMSPFQYSMSVKAK
jgi:AraC-like DNA-binding protein